MNLELVNATIVIVAQQFNPSIIRDHWLIKHCLVKEDEFLEGCVFTDAFSNVQSQKFNLLVVPDQMQFVPKVEFESQQKLLEEKVGTIVEKLPHTPYTAIGLNFTWHLSAEATSIEDFSRKLFWVCDSPLGNEFNAKDARFGAYFSRDLLGRRLKLDAKPVTATKAGEQFDALQFAFNFHRDIEMDEESVPIIRESLSTWSAAHKESKRLMDVVTAGDTR